MAISLGPIASGLPKDIVDRLMEAERRPLEMLQARKRNEEDRLKLVQDLSTRLNNINAEIQKFGRYKQFRELGYTSGRPDLMDVTVNNEEASPGEYSLQILQLAGKSSMLSNGFTDPDNTQIGVGYFSYELPDGETKEVYIDSSENTLDGIARKINSQKGLDLTAIVVNDGTGSDAPWRLIISHNKSGEVNDAEFPSFYFIDGDEDFYLEKERPAQNSVVKVNGFDVEFEGTRVTSLLPGVTLDLKDFDPGKEFSLRIFEDRAKITGKVKTLVEKINQVLQFIQTQNTLDENSNTSNTLGGDITLQNLENLIRRIVLSPRETDEGEIRFSDMGVTFQRNGLLEINESKLAKAVEERLPEIAQYFTGINDLNDGFIGELTGNVKSYVRPGGIVYSRQDGLKTRIKDIDRQIENTEKNLEQSRKMLTEKFANLESAMARLKAQQAQVQGSLGGAGGAADLIKLSQ